MFTSQLKYNNADGDTKFYTYVIPGTIVAGSGEQTADSASPRRFTSDKAAYDNLPDGTLGIRRFYEFRGYAVSEAYNQPTDNVATGGFSFAQYKAEIDAGWPVILHLGGQSGVPGHSIIGIGYDAATNLIYFHDGWDYNTHSITWGSSYASMPLLMASVIHAIPPAHPGDYTVSGYAGVPNATITYTGGSTTADTGGYYSFSVPPGWSGKVTPSKPGYTFNPPYRDYSNIPGYQTEQNHTATAIPGSNRVNDPGFELDTPNPYWTESSTHFGSVLCDLSTCGGNLAHTGQVWGWFGGLEGMTETAAVSQTVVIPQGPSASLDFCLWIAEADAGSDMHDEFTVKVDGAPLFSADATQIDKYSVYTPVRVDVSAYANGASHAITFTSTTTQQFVLFNLDDVSLAVSTPAGLPDGWVGGVSVTSDKKVVTVGRPHIGAEVASYDGFTQGSLTSYVPMLFRKAYGTYNSALYVQNVAGTQATVTIKYYDSDGNLKCAKNDTIPALSSKGYWLPTETCNTGSLLDGFVGGAVVTSTQPIVAVGRPHVGNEIMTYDGFTAGSTSSYIPMLFKGAYGGTYNSAFYIQNVAGTPAAITIKYYDSEGVLKCTKADMINPLASKGYWVPSATCDSGSLPAGWIGGVVVTSDQPIVGVGRPHIGTQVTTYNGFTAGNANSYIPMLFKGAYGGTYNAAFYLQNTSSNPATVTIKYYSSTGTLDCTKTDTIQPLASKGYWVPTATCTTGSIPPGWIGGVVVSSTQPLVGVGRPHIGAQVTTYNGFTAGNVNAYLPMLFKAAYDGSYNSAFYIQNTENSLATVTVKFYDTGGNLTCYRQGTVAALATLGYWVPTVSCNQ